MDLLRCFITIIELRPYKIEMDKSFFLCYLFLMYSQYAAAYYKLLALLEEECKLAGLVEIFHLNSDYNRMMAFLFPTLHDYETDDAAEEEEVEQSLAFFHFQFR